MAAKKKPKRVRYGAATIATAVDRANSGETHVSIAADLGTTPATVGAWVRKRRANGENGHVPDTDWTGLPPTNPPPPSLVPPDIQREIDKLITVNRALRGALRELLKDE